MHLLEFVPFFTVLAVALLGFGSIVLSLVVWRRRRADVAATRRSLLRRAGLAVGVFGGFLLLLSLCLRTFFPRRGEVYLRDAQVVRADVDRGVPVLPGVDSLSAGEVLVRFEHARLEAERASLGFEKRALEAERRRLEAAPLESDALRERRRAELRADLRALGQRVLTAQIEHDRLASARSLDLVQHKRQRFDLLAELAQFDAETARAAAAHEYEKTWSRTGSVLRDKDVLSELVVARRKRDERLARAEMGGVAARQDQRRAFLVTLERAIRELERDFDVSAKRNASVLAACAAERAEMTAALEALEAGEAQARVTARSTRACEIEALDAEIARCASRVETLARATQIRAREAGAFVYRHPAPASALDGEALAVFARPGAVRARFRLNRREAELLVGGEPVALLATSHEILRPRLSALCEDARAIPHEDGMVLADFACEPSQDHVRFLARGMQLEARLLWAPPVYLDPLFLLACLCLFAAFVAHLVPRRSARAVREARPAPAPATRVALRRKSG